MFKIRQEGFAESIESSEDFDSYVEKSIGKALDLLKERYETRLEEKDNLPFHKVEHTQEVIRRVEAILRTIQEADPTLVSDHDVGIGRLASAYHDAVQIWEENRVKDGEFEKVLRKRLVGKNEAASGDEAIAFMVKINENKVIFSDNDKVTVQRAIDTTVPDWDVKNETVMQPNLKESSSLVERALALADLATAGMDGSEKFLKEGSSLFREENLDILEAIRSGDDIPKNKQEYFKKRMVGWLKSQPGFAKGRQARLEAELQPIPEQARKLVTELFDRFEDSIEKSKEVADKAEEMTFEELVKYMGY